MPPAVSPVLSCRKEEHSMDPKKPFAEEPEDEYFERPPASNLDDEFEDIEEVDEEIDKADEDDDTGVDIDETMDRESFTDRRHGRRHDGPADISNPGTV